MLMVGTCIAENVELTYRLNILAMFAMAKYAVPHMKRGSSIINSTSVAAYMGNPELVDYSSTKGKRSDSIARPSELKN